jgi:predicted AlkP superfamily pyrophosphatase or phosphodiesterase
MRLISILIVFTFLTTVTFSQKKTDGGKPKLVVGIVVDQMRYDYIYTYWDKLSSNGFKKLVNKGYNCKNTNYNYVPTYTGPGHASIYTGTTPAVHGIISNDWYNAKNGKDVYCVSDSLFQTVGAVSPNGKMSPSLLLTTTIGDELKINSNGKSKVIGVSLKDRAAILPAGHNADGAYWLCDSTGNWITSSFFENELPQWVKNYNDKKRVDELLSKKWETYYPIEQYTESLEDNSKYERKFKGEKAPVFPHDLPLVFDSLTKRKYSLIKATPFGNTTTKEMAIEAIKGEQLGKDFYTDMLCVSFSSPDYIGHQFGPKSIEQEDDFIRLDLEISELITFLEKEVGKDNFVLFLTADHAAVDVPSFLSDQKIPAGYTNLSYAGKIFDSLLKAKLGIPDEQGSFLSKVMNQQVYFNHDFISNIKINPYEVEDYFIQSFKKLDGVLQIYTSSEMEKTDYTDLVPGNIQNGYYAGRSGDLIINLEPGWVEYYKTGTTHGSPYSYDSHVPLIWYGKKITPGFTSEFIPITHIAPTICLMLDIPFTSGNTGQPIPEIVKGFNRK